MNFLTIEIDSGYVTSLLPYDLRISAYVISGGYIYLLCLLLIDGEEEWQVEHLSPLIISPPPFERNNKK